MPAAALVSPMHALPGVNAQLIRTRVPHKVRTATVRDDWVGVVVAGRKRLVTPLGEVCFVPGQAFCIARGTQWDMINEPAPGGQYEARLLAFAPSLVARFHAGFGQFAATPVLQDCAGTVVDETVQASFDHAWAALHEAETSTALREHRALEVLLLLAERGLVFAGAAELSWAERVHRLVAQRPHAGWTVDQLAQAFHLSASTLQRRLAQQHTSVSRCVREVRMEAAMAMLQGSTLPVSAVAARCGYDSHSRFSAAFRQRFGYTPSQLRP